MNTKCALDPPTTGRCLTFKKITMVKVNMVAVMVIFTILVTTPMHVSDGTPTDWNGLPHLTDDTHNPFLQLTVKCKWPCSRVNPHKLERK